MAQEGDVVGTVKEQAEQREALLEVDSPAAAFAPASPSRGGLCWRPARFIACIALGALVAGFAAAGAAWQLLALRAGTDLVPEARAPPGKPPGDGPDEDGAWPEAVISAYQEAGPGLLEGTWMYGKYGLYHISRDDLGMWHFAEHTVRGTDVSGALHQDGPWFEGGLTDPLGKPQGNIRLRRGNYGTLVSNYVPPGGLDWSRSQNVVARNATNDYYVLLEVFRLTGTRWALGGLYHSQMAICPKREFGYPERRAMEGLQRDPTQSFAEVPPALWRRSRATCYKLSFGGVRDASRCSGVGMQRQPLRLDSALIRNVERGVAWKYLYGTGPFSGGQAAARLCRSRCGNKWSGTMYDLVQHNCNTFTSTVLKCVYGLSQAKPNLGVSDMNWADCSC